MWEAAKEEEMKIPWKEAQEGLPVPEDQYQERFWRRRLDGIGLDTVKTTVRSVWTNSVRNAFRRQAGWAKLQKVRAMAATQWTKRGCGVAKTNAGCRRRRKEWKRQRVEVSKMKGSGAGDALRIWITGEWESQQQVRGVRTSSSEKDPAEKRLERG